jgi:SAM-dependent methyltransferase
MNRFDERAREWDTPARIERARQVAAAIRRVVPLSPAMKAMEYGCGTGLLTFSLLDVLGQTVLADNSPGMLEVLAGKVAASGRADLAPLCLDLIHDPLPAERFDLIYTLLTLHHIPETDLLIERFAALLAPAGWLCIADLDQEDGSFHGEGFEGHNGFDRADLAGRLSRNGLNVTYNEIILFVQREVHGAMRPFPLFLMAAQKS